MALRGGFSLNGVLMLIRTRGKEGAGEYVTIFFLFFAMEASREVRKRSLSRHRFQSFLGLLFRSFPFGRAIMEGKASSWQKRASSISHTHPSIHPAFLVLVFGAESSPKFLSVSKRKVHTAIH